LAGLCSEPLVKKKHGWPLLNQISGCLINTKKLQLPKENGPTGRGTHSKRKQASQSAKKGICVEKQKSSLLQKNASKNWAN